MAADTSQKTEAPTPRRLKEAREKGQVAKSHDLSAWAGMLATIVLLQITIKRGATRSSGVLEDMGLAIAHPDQAGAMQFATGAALKARRRRGPDAGRDDAASAWSSGVGQVGLKPTVKKLKPDFGRLNVFKGIKRTFGAQVWWEVAKSIAQDRRCSSRSRGPRSTHAVDAPSRRPSNGSLAEPRADHRDDRAHDAAQRRDRRPRDRRRSTTSCSGAGS